MLAQERIPVRCVAKCFRAPCAGDRKRASAVCKFQTVFNFCAADELVDESSVKRIAGTNGIHDIHYWRVRTEFLFSNAGHCALRTTLDYQDADFLRERLDGLLDIVHLRQLAKLSLVRQKNVH